MPVRYRLSLTALCSVPCRGVRVGTPGDRSELSGQCDPFHGSERDVRVSRPDATPWPCAMVHGPRCHGPWTLDAT
eukprot:2247301-Prymnesium_polylepis.1